MVRQDVRMPLARLAQPSLLTDRVFDEIHAAIMSGELPAGAPLRVRDLAGQVGTSVMPVREAIRRLEESGLVVREPYKGAVVKRLSVDELDQTYDLRILLECEAARRGAGAATRIDHQSMRRLHAEILQADAAGQLIEALDLDEELLTVLYSAAGNPALLESIKNLWQRARLYKVHAVRNQNPADANAWGHLPLLVDAAEDGDGAAAARVTRDSLVNAQRHIQEYLAATLPAV
jgi:DNA-binding GntR family transcriptional regulator